MNSDKKRNLNGITMIRDIDIYIQSKLTSKVTEEYVETILRKVQLTRLNLQYSCTSLVVMTIAPIVLV